MLMSVRRAAVLLRRGPLKLARSLGSFVRFLRSVLLATRRNDAALLGWFLAQQSHWPELTARSGRSGRRFAQGVTDESATRKVLVGSRRRNRRQVRRKFFADPPAHPGPGCFGKLRQLPRASKIHRGYGRAGHARAAGTSQAVQG